jgi:ribosomal protein L20
MKKINIKREIKPAKKIENTHAEPEQKEEKIKKEKKDILYKVKDKRESKTTSIRLYTDEIEKINEYLKEHNLKFSELIRMLLAEKGII